MKRLLRRCADWIDLQWSVLEHSLRAVAPQARGRLLDVGCGDKPYEAWFRPFVSAYVGVEHGDTFASTAEGVRGRPDVVYNGGTLPFRDGSFDTVLSVQVLEHTPHPAALMAEMSRVLAPDGLLILTAPFQFRLHEQPHDYFRYSPHGLRQLCADVGLEVFETALAPGRARRPPRPGHGEARSRGPPGPGRPLVDPAGGRADGRGHRGRGAPHGPLVARSRRVARLPRAGAAERLQPRRGTGRIVRVTGGGCAAGTLSSSAIR